MSLLSPKIVDVGGFLLLLLYPLKGLFGGILGSADTNDEAVKTLSNYALFFLTLLGLNLVEILPLD